MISLCCRLAVLSLFLLNFSHENQDQENLPTVLIAILVRNKAHSLPYVLGAVEKLAYPKAKLSVWFAVDHSKDRSHEVVAKWARESTSLYKSVSYLYIKHPTDYSNASSVFDWPDERIRNLLKLKQQALDIGRLSLADYVLYLDADIVLTNENSLQLLISANQSLVSPVLHSVTEPEYATNFWGDITDNGYYKRSENYFDIHAGRQVGVFQVAVVHSAFLLRLNDTKRTNFSFYPLPSAYPKSWPLDDMPLLNFVSRKSGLKLHVLNSQEFGFYHSTETDYFPSSNLTLSTEVGAFKHLLLEFNYHTDGREFILPSPVLKDFPLTAHKRLFGFDKIFLVNLKRRPDRLESMKFALDVLGVDYSVFEAVDGKLLNETSLDAKGIRMLPGYSDPYHNRSLTFGEVGCFLSHFEIWTSMKEEASRRVLILEDDLRFHANFEQRLEFVLDEADTLVPNWELLYLGRKIMSRGEELIPNSRHLVRPSYTYWTLSYAITLAGAEKLLRQNPLSKLVAVDEFLPIMFDHHPNDQWKAAYPQRDLVALSAAPLLVEPKYYVGMTHYVSDTERSAPLCVQDDSSVFQTSTNQCPGLRYQL